MQFSPVKETALKYQIPVFQPKKIRDKECVEELRKYAADVMVVIAFGQIPVSYTHLQRYHMSVFFYCENVHGADK